MTVDELRSRGESLICAQSAIVTELAVRQLADIAGVGLDELLETPNCPQPIRVTASGRYYDRASLLRWWRGRLAINGAQR